VGSLSTPPSDRPPPACPPPQELAALSARREALQLAEQLFDLPVTPYPALAAAEAELRRLGEVFGVYGKYLDAVRGYGGQLWSELDVGRMVDGVQEVGRGREEGRRAVRWSEGCRLHVQDWGLALSGNQKQPAFWDRPGAPQLGVRGLVNGF
jgi:hypothetical protein